MNYEWKSRGLWLGTWPLGDRAPMLDARCEDRPMLPDRRSRFLPEWRGSGDIPALVDTRQYEAILEIDDERAWSAPIWGTFNEAWGWMTAIRLHDMHVRPPGARSVLE